MTLPPAVFLVGLAQAALVTNVLLIDDIRDVGFDRLKGWRTATVRFGQRFTRREHLALTVLAYASPCILAWRFGTWSLLPLATLPFAVVVERAVQTAKRREELIPWTPRSAFLSVGYAALVAAGLGLARTLP